MKYLFICHNLEIGGTEIYLLRLTKYLKCERGVDIDILCTSGQYGKLENEFRSNNINLINMKVGYYNVLTFIKFGKLLINKNYDTTCDMSGNFAGLTTFISKLAGIKNRIVFYRSSKDTFKSTFPKVIYLKLSKRLLYQSATYILSNSRQALINNYSRNSYKVDKRFNVIQNGIIWDDSKITQEKKLRYLKRFQIPQNWKIIGHVGRYTRAKNYDNIIKVAEIFSKHRSDVCFLLIGRGIEKNLIDELKYKKIDNIHFAGESRSVSHILQLIDVFYFPSLREGQPNALLEAIGYGIPFIASNINEILECFPKWWGNRWLVDSKNIETSHRLLDQLIKNSAYNVNFIKLVEWVRNHYSGLKRFNQVNHYLSNRN